MPGQFATIQAAVAAIERPTTIVVAPGVYRESVVVADTPYVVIQSAALSRRGVTLAGGDAATTLLVAERSTVHLSGIDLRSNGRARGISVRDAAISLQDCTVIGNRIAHGNGAGMDCRNASVHIQKSTIAGNVIDAREGEEEIRGAGLCLDGCRVEIAGSNVQTNAGYSNGRARGGGIWCEGSRMRMWKSRVTDNLLEAPDCAGAGLYVRASPRCDLGGSVVSGNSQPAGRGGGIFVDDDATNVAVHRNTVVRQNYPDDVFRVR